ncbi:UvrD-helicase domain-containing protein [Empedobacter falsenii]
MDKRLMLAVAGSGKTRYIIENLCLNKRYLVITYTINNYNTIRNRIISKFGYLPSNITLYKYFDFLYNFCTKPFTLFKYNVKGIHFELPPTFTLNLKINKRKRYFTNTNKLYHNRISKFLEITNIIPKIIHKIEMFYDCIIIDEFQDLGGHDFNFIMQISQAKINILYVGDFYQNTYVTSFDGNVNSNLFKNYSEYIKRITSYNIQVDTKTLLKSYRCPPIICEFISNQLGVNIESANNNETNIFILDKDDNFEHILNDDRIIKLVYSNSKKNLFFSKNWGECKGEDNYNDTCIILTKSATKLLQKGKLIEMPNSTKNKLYVALSRTKGNCYIIKQ